MECDCGRQRVPAPSAANLGPVRAASLQVHRARMLVDGRVQQVAVKVGPSPALVLPHRRQSAGAVTCREAHICAAGLLMQSSSALLSASARMP